MGSGVVRRHDECGECSRMGEGGEGVGSFFFFFFLFLNQFFLSVYKQNPVRRWVNDSTVCDDDEDDEDDENRDGEQDGRPPTYRYIPRGGGEGGWMWL